MSRIILDTDIGSDTDDAVALALAMNSPEIKLEGVTTVYGDVQLRARLVKELLRIGGREEINIYPGLSETLLRNRDVWWAGHEGDGVVDGNKSFEYKGHAVDFIIKTIMDNPGVITLVAIGPLTNVAAAIIREPKIINHVKEIILMGGVHRLGNNGAELKMVEHNIKCDPEAASVVFSSQAPIVMVGLDVTMKVEFTQAECDLLRKSGHPLNEVIANMIEKWFGYLRKRSDIPWTGKDKTHMHDPLAVSLLLNRSLVTTRRMKVKVEYDHREGTGQTNAIVTEDGNVEACMDVDHEAFMKLLLTRLN